MPTKRTRLKRHAVSFRVDKFTVYQLKRTIINGDPWKLNLSSSPGSYDVYALVTGNFFDGYLKYCRANDEDSQRLLWGLLRDDIVAAAEKLGAPKPWGCRFDG